jgi:hypothetical protein
MREEEVAPAILVSLSRANMRGDVAAPFERRLADIPPCDRSAVAALLCRVARKVVLGDCPSAAAISDVLHRLISTRSRLLGARQ